MQEDIKVALYRIFSDIVKADEVISVMEMDILEKFCRKFEITSQDRKDSWKVSLEQALCSFSKSDQAFKDEVLRELEGLVFADGDCNRNESLMIEALNLCGKDSGVYSMPLQNLPINTSQMIYLEDRQSCPSADIALEGDGSFMRIDSMARLGGFHIIYIPRFARYYLQYSSVEDIERVVSLVSPIQSPEQVINTVSILQHMSSRYFYRNILKEKLGFTLEIERPVWLIRLFDDVVDGRDYANFLWMEAGRDVLSQVGGFVSRVNSRMHEYSIITNRARNASGDFLYRGFYKAILDVMSIKTVDRWGVRFRAYGDGVPMFKDQYTGKKTVLTIFKEDQECPVEVSARDAAFYLLLLCSSFSEERGLDFSDRSSFRRIQSAYEAIYQKLSRRSVDGDTPYQRCPDVTAAQTRIPMKSRLCSALKKTSLTEQTLYLPEEDASGRMYIPLERERVEIEGLSESCRLNQSSLYKEVVGILRND